MVDETQASAAMWAHAILESSGKEGEFDFALNIREDAEMDIITELKRLGCQVSPAGHGNHVYTISRTHGDA